jgi:hypothetical protein
LQKCTLSSQLRTVGPLSFADCGALREVTMPEGVGRIASYAFWRTGLECLKLPLSVRVIESCAFGHTKLREIILPEGVQTIGSSAFYGAALEHVMLPQSLRVIEELSFAETKLREVAIPDGVETIGPSAFSGIELEMVGLPPSLRRIGANAFAGTALVEINIPDSVMEVGQRAFDCELDRVSVGVVADRKWGAKVFGAGRKPRFEVRGDSKELQTQLGVADAQPESPPPPNAPPEPAPREPDPPEPAPEEAPPAGPWERLADGTLKNLGAEQPEPRQDEINAPRS